MVHSTRRKLFYFLVLVFVASSPLLISYALGYKFNLTTRAVEQTGGIFIKSKIPALSVFLDNTFIKETSLLSGGAILTDVRPGTHLIRIEKPEYLSWSKKIEVRPEIVTEFRNTVLIPQPLRTATSTKKEVELLSKVSKTNQNLTINKRGHLVDKKTGAILAKNVNSFGEVGRGVLFVDKNGFLAEINPLTKAVQTLGRPGFYFGTAAMKFVESLVGDVAILDSSGGLFILNQQDQLTALEGNIISVAFDGAGAKLLIAKENEISIIWFSDNSYQPFQKKGTKEIVFKSDSPIRDAEWFYKDNAHIVVRTDEGIFFIELDGRGGRNVIKLVSGIVAELTTVPDIPEAVFFKRGKNWYKIEL